MAAIALLAIAALAGVAGAVILWGPGGGLLVFAVAAGLAGLDLARPDRTGDA